MAVKEGAFGIGGGDGGDGGCGCGDGGGFGGVVMVTPLEGSPSSGATG